jgi:hypothetical protein
MARALSQRVSASPASEQMRSAERSIDASARQAVSQGPPTQSELASRSVSLGLDA